jgi:hypothetical protein
MRVFFSLFLSMVLSAGAFAAPQNAVWCRPDKPARVDVRAGSEDIRWDFSKSTEQLRNFDIDTKNPYGDHGHFEVGGLMKGGINMEQTMRFSSLTHQGLRQICVYYDSVNVRFNITPTIYIANKHQPGTCKHNAIKEHEMKHIAVDRKIVNKYAALVGRMIKAEIDRAAIYGPVPFTQAAQVQSHMKQRMENILRTASAQMEAERAKLQQAVDSREEYDRVSRQCQPQLR